MPHFRGVAHTVPMRAVAGFKQIINRRRSRTPVATGIAESLDKPAAFRVLLHAQGGNDFAGLHAGLHSGACIDGVGVASLVARSRENHYTTFLGWAERLKWSA